jgi:hypothetical protein
VSVKRLAQARSDRHFFHGRASLLATQSFAPASRWRCHRGNGARIFRALTIGKVEDHARRIRTRAMVVWFVWAVVCDNTPLCSSSTDIVREHQKVSTSSGELERALAHDSNRSGGGKSSITPPTLAVPQARGLANALERS